MSALPESSHAFRNGTFCGGGIDSFTKLCLHCDGTNGAAAFPDASSSGNNFLPTYAGIIDTSQAEFGGSSLRITYEDSPISSPGGLFGDSATLTDLALGSGNFVVDFWLFVPTTPTASTYLVDWGQPTNPTTMPTIILDTSVQVNWYTQNAFQITGTPLTFNVWTHIAIVKSSNVTKLFYNGVQAGSNYTDNNTYAMAGANAPSIGVGTDGHHSQKGWYDEFRVSIGTDRGWSNGFTPPTQPYTSDGFTHLLLHFDGVQGQTTFPDSSSFNHTVTNGGHIAITDTSTFKFGTASLKITNANDIYAIAGGGASNLALGSGNFVVDFWVRTTETGGVILMDWGFSNNSALPCILMTGLQIEWFAAGGAQIAGPTLPSGVWTHVAVVRSSGSTRMFMNGVQGGGTYTDANNYGVDPLGPYVGCFIGSGFSADGHYDEIRISIGTDRGWFNGFTPQTCAYS